MCPPVFYKIPFVEDESHLENDFMIDGAAAFSQDPDLFKKTADQQWSALYKSFENLGVNIQLLNPVIDIHNQVFTADPLLCFQRTDGHKMVLLSQFSNPTRVEEVEQASLFAKQSMPDFALVQNVHYSEGTGDHLYDPYRNLFWSGYALRTGPQYAAHGRTSIESHKVIAVLTGLRVISLNVQRPFFHLDTCFTPLPTGHILCYRDGLSPEAFETIQHHAFAPYDLDPSEYLIEISRDDAYDYACNVRVVGNVIVMAHCSDALKSRLKTIGYDVINHNLSHFIHYGGGVHCLTNNLSEIEHKKG
jgi:N-dimethylarginine dimethylaminohydrolase